MKLRTAVLLTPVFASACFKPIDAAAVSARAAEQAAQVVRAGQQSVAFSTAASSTPTSLRNTPIERALSKAITSFSAQGMKGGFFGPLTPALQGGKTPGAKDDHPSADSGARLEEFLKTRVFVKANLEKVEGPVATYLLHADPTCRGLDSSGSTDVSAGCKKVLDAQPVHVLLQEEDNDGEKVSVVVGTERASLVTWSVHPNAIAFEWSLSGTQRAIQLLAQASGEDVSLPEVMKGTLRQSLRKEAEKKATLSLEVLADVDIELNSASGVRQLVFKTSARPTPVFSLTGDGEKKSLSVTLGMGSTESFTPWDPQQTGAVNTDYHVALQGLTGTLNASYGTDSNQYEVRNLSLGEGKSHIDVRGQTVESAELNALTGHKLDVDVSETVDGHVRYSLAPSLDLDVAFAFANVASEMSDPPPSYALDEAYHLRLAGAPGNQVAELFAADESEFWKVIAGTLTLTSNKSDTVVTATPGKCVQRLQTAPEGTHPLLGTFVVDDCP